MTMLILRTYSSEDEVKRAGSIHPVIDEDTKRWYFSNESWMYAHGMWEGPVEVDGVVYPEGIQVIEYSDIRCEFDECPFLALEDKEFCKLHQKEFENIQAGREPDEDY